MLFEDRHEAGRRLAEQLTEYRGRGDVLILAIPRGGVAVGSEVARALGAPLDVIVTRKIGAPGQEEYAIGVVAETGQVFLNESEVALLGVTRDYLDRQIAEKRAEIEHRIRAFRGGRPLLALRGKTVIVVDDGIATGFTTRAALAAVRAAEPKELVLAVPVGPPEAVAMFGQEVDRVVVLATPEPFWAIGAWYGDFHQLSDEEVRQLLVEADHHSQAA